MVERITPPSEGLCKMVAFENAYIVTEEGLATAAPPRAIYVSDVALGVDLTKNGPDPYVALVPLPTITWSGEPGTRP